MDYQPVVVPKHARPAPAKHSAESRYWRQFKHPVFVKEFAPVTSVHFAPSKPHRYAVTAATRVQIYAPRTQKVTKTIARFKDVARSGHIRGDGKLLVAGDDSGLIQIFDVNSRAILRTLDAHKQPVHVSRFSPLDHTQVLSCSDDTTVRLWDVPSQSTITLFEGHTDYVRTGQISTTDPHLVLSGSYDGTVRLFDARTGTCEMLMQPAGGAVTPVEQVLMFPSGTAALSSAGNILRVWDLVAGGRCIRALSNHQKTVTALAFNANASRLLTGGLDHMVKVYDVANYNVMHTMRYPAPVLCLAVSPDETHIAVGMSDGTLSVRRRQQKASEATASSDSPFSLLAGGAYESFLGTDVSGIGERHLRDRTKSRRIGDVNELRVESRRRKRLKVYDRLLKSFKYSAALDSVLQKKVPPTTTFALIQELIHRDGLRTALSSRDDVLLEPILRLLLKHVTDPRFGEMVCDVALVTLDMYAPVLGQSPLIDTLFVRLRKKVEAELAFQKELVKIRGALEMLFASSALAHAPPPS
ncbi:WD40 repeat-like protein [Vararia minispora EC-137]|uniref:WD40 repeat-like protein n=1 Tax=Vararia minispora EC-137 TaxID=1314806 RepID=A0ACB8QWG0_9AGAM|nr:WD40 repeat-like protein [Vararia minispora EC-137]